MLPDGPERSILEDAVEYALPLGALGRLAGGAFARRRLARTFAWRHQATRAALSTAGAAGAAGAAGGSSAAGAAAEAL